MTKLLSIGPAELYISGNRREMIKKITETLNETLDAYEAMLRSPEYRAIALEKGLTANTEIRLDLNVEITHGSEVGPDRLEEVAAQLAEQQAQKDAAKAASAAADTQQAA